jgi:hypothetical protein
MPIACHRGATLGVGLALACASFACNPTIAPAPTAPGAPTTPAEPSPRFSEGALDADNLATFLGLDVNTFEYEGGYPKCWVEITEEGQKTVGQAKVLEIAELNRVPGAKRGKILFFLKRGLLATRIQSRSATNNAQMALPDDALWWGWKSQSSGMTERHPTEPKLGETVTLMKTIWAEIKDDSGKPEKPRRVQLELKAVLTE